MDPCDETLTDAIPAPGSPLPGAQELDGWLVSTVRETTSTNLLAARMPRWSAVRARTQTAGRGRFQRSWISNEGGLWLSAVVPIGEGTQWRVLPLAIGLAVNNALRQAGARQLRMRWPNDLLTDNRKLAGLLLDRFESGCAVAGIGINVFNNPGDGDPSLRNQTARLADLVSAPPSLDELAGSVLRQVRQVIGLLESGQTARLHSEINTLWGEPRRVELDLDGELRRGLFSGVDTEGNLILLDEFGGSSTFGAHQVRHLKELDS